MKNYRLVYWPDPVLTSVAAPVKTFDAEIKGQVAAMFRVMTRHGGMGLAANQVGCLNRIFVMNALTPIGTSKPLACINPEIIWQSRLKFPFPIPEICLSIPGQDRWVPRPWAMVIRYRDTDGKPCIRKLWGINAVAADHEIDHLNGKLIIDRKEASIRPSVA